jgi:hypothetical protein
MSTTCELRVSSERGRADHGVVHLRSRPEDTVDLPVAVGFGSTSNGGRRKLHAVPAAAAKPVTIPGPGRAGRLIHLPLTRVGGAESATATPRSKARRVRRQPAGPTVLPEVSSVRLTVRGQVAALAVAGGIGLAVVTAAWFGAGSETPPTHATPPARIVVHEGDTLWSIAGRISPEHDPRVVVDQLLRLNGMDTPALVPGEVLRTR